MKYYYKVHDFCAYIPELEEVWEKIRYDLENDHILTMVLKSQAQAMLARQSEAFELQNGCDVRRFQERGVKEISKEIYDRIVEDDIRIVANRNEQSKYLIEKFLPEDFKNAWHRPFMTE